MKQAIIIVSYFGSPWLQECLNSINTMYPVIVVLNNKQNCKYEYLGIEKGIQLGIEEFIVLHDTMIIKDNAMFDILFTTEGNVSIGNNYFMLLGKYVLKDLLTIELPIVHDKLSAIQAELVWGTKYFNYVKAKSLIPTLTDTNIFEDKHGRTNMILETPYFKKFKGCWDIKMVKNG